MITMLKLLGTAVKIYPPRRSGAGDLYRLEIRSINKTIKVKVKVKFTLEQATKAQRWSRGITLLFL